MKIFSGPKSPDDPARQKVQGCMATNLAVPGLGSLVGGRKIGLLQMALYLSGFVMSLVFGLRFIYWSLAHWLEYHGPAADADPIKAFLGMWTNARWPLSGAFLGIGMCLSSWLWALATSRSLLVASKPKPPTLNTVPDEK